MPIIILFILILNVVSILLMYRSLNAREPKEKLLFIVIGTALMYVLTSTVYWISTRNIEITEVSDLGKDLIIFLFVPINGIIVLPLFARFYCKFKDGGISNTVLRNREIVLGVILLILLIVECTYFENIQKQVVNMINERNNQTQQGNDNNEQLEATANDINSNETVESTNTSNLIEVETTNVVNDNTVNENIEQTNTEMENAVEGISSNIVNQTIDPVE